MSIIWKLCKILIRIKISDSYIFFIPLDEASFVAPICKGFMLSSLSSFITSKPIAFSISRTVEFWVMSFWSCTFYRSGGSHSFHIFWYRFMSFVPCWSGACTTTQNLDKCCLLNKPTLKCCIFLIKSPNPIKITLS